MKLVVCGDPHAEISSLEEVGRLVDWMCWVFDQEQADGFVLMGDLFHNHSVVHLPVMEFWHKAFKKLKTKACQSRGILEVIVGNHDKTGNANSKAHSLMLYDTAHITEDAFAVNGVLFVGYQHDPQRFVDLCNAKYNRDMEYVYCHQTFYGSRYENGFYAPAEDSINPDLIPQKIISGHIHTPQEFGKVWYIGAPRWRIKTDTNVKRNIWVIDHKDGTGEILSKRPYPTHIVCSAMYEFDDREDNPLHIATLPGGEVPPRVTINIHGSQEFINGRKGLWEENGFKIRTFAEKTFKLEVKESHGIVNSFNAFLTSFKPKNGTDNQTLINLSKERIPWMK